MTAFVIPTRGPVATRVFGVAGVQGKVAAQEVRAIVLEAESHRLFETPRSARNLGGRRLAREPA